MPTRNLQRVIDTTRLELVATGEVLKGSLSKVILGKRRRASGHRIVYLLTYKRAGNKTRSLYVAHAQVSEVRRLIANYHKARRALDKMAELNVELYRTRQAMKRSQRA